MVTLSVLPVWLPGLPALAEVQGMPRPGPPAGQLPGTLDGGVRRSNSVTVVAGPTWRVPAGMNPRRRYSASAGRLAVPVATTARAAGSSRSRLSSSVVAMPRRCARGCTISRQMSRVPSGSRVLLCVGTEEFARDLEAMGPAPIGVARK
jgi:hypothetical protein